MSDICKCLTEGCEKEKTCYRKTSVAGEYQPYSYFGKDGNCSFYIRDKDVDYELIGFERQNFDDEEGFE